jgi:hypothetical protein
MFAGSAITTLLVHLGPSHAYCTQGQQTALLVDVQAGHEHNNCEGQFHHAVCDNGGDSAYGEWMNNPDMDMKMIVSIPDQVLSVFFEYYNLEGITSIIKHISNQR